MKSVFKQVEEFNKEIIGVTLDGGVKLMNSDDFMLSSVQLHEEIAEFEAAYENQDLPEVIDAMIDLIYFAAGVCTKTGVSAEKMEEAFRTVHNANMTKKAGKKAERDYDGDATDAMKPQGWKAPVLEDILYGK